MIITKTRPTADQLYQRVSYINDRFGHLPGFRRVRTGRHAEARDPQPLMMESLGARLGVIPLAERNTRRQQSRRGARKAACRVICNERVAAERTYREWTPADLRTPQGQKELVNKLLADDKAYQQALRVLNPDV